MKKYQVNLASGDKLVFNGVRMTRDGGGVHIYGEDDSLVAGFNYVDVTSAYEIQNDTASKK